MARVFFSALSGAFVGKILAALFIAVCLMFGIGPDNWAEWIISGLGDQITPSIARYAFLTLAALTAFAVFGPSLWRLIFQSPTKLSVAPGSNVEHQIDQTISDALAEYLLEAQELRDRKIRTEEEFDAWKSDYQGWFLRTKNFIRENVSPTQAIYFADIGLIVVRRIAGAFNDDHNSLLNQLGVYQSNLRHLHSLESR